MNAAEQNKKLMPPYIQEYYNVSCLTNDDLNTRTIGCIVNALTDALSKKHKLPRLILVVINKDIIADIDVFDHQAVRMIRDAVDWFTRQIDILIRRKRLEIVNRRPGAIFDDDPAIMFVRMLRRADLHLRRGSKLDETYVLRAKFNDALNDAAARKEHNILTVNTCNIASHFDHLGNLSDKGKTDFWLEIDEQIR